MFYLKGYRYLIAVLFAVWAMGYSNKLSAQCDFNVNAVMQKDSDCQSNGIIEVTLSGTDVANGNIDISDAKFSIESTTAGGYVQAPMSNNGIITNVPPGQYKITVQVYCKKSNSWQIKKYPETPVVTVTSSYVVPNINNIKILSAGIQKSLKCEATGSIPINIEGGKPPYTVIVSSFPPGYSGPTSFTQPTEGVLTIDSLPAGTYSFIVQDDCTYRLEGIPPATVDEIQPSYTIGKTTPTVSCAKDGVIPITVKDGAVPYTIEMVNPIPPSYTGPTTFTINTDSTINITGLPNGSYTFKVKDKCYEKTLTATVKEILFEASQETVTGTTTCDNTGSVKISMDGGQAPYTVTVTSTTSPKCFDPPRTYTYTTSGSPTIGGLCEGTYTIEVKDSCGKAKTFTTTITAIDLSAIVKSVTAAAGSCNTTGEAVIEITGGKKPYKVSLVTTNSPYYVNPGTQVTNDNSYTIKNLSPGNYTFEIEDGCGKKQTVSFTVDDIPMAVVAQAGVGSFGCIATGQMIITVASGKPPYIVELISSIPSVLPYPPPSPIPSTNPPNGNIFEVNNLPIGIYEFEIIDACGDRDTVIGVIDSLPKDYHFNFYHDFFIQPNPKDAACKDVIIRRNTDATDDLGYYWNKDPGKYYEVAFAEDIAIIDTTSKPIPQGLLDTLDWNPVTSPKDSLFTLSRGYCQMRSDSGYVVVYLRVIDSTSGFLCGVSTDTIRMDELKVEFSTPYDQSCDGYSVDFKLKGLFCYPYEWELLDVPGGSIIKGPVTGLNDPEQTVTNIPYGRHVFKFTDNENCSWYSDTLEYYWSPPPSVGLDFERDCSRYNLIFDISDVCPPYTWALCDSLKIPMVGVGGSVSSISYVDTVTGLEFDKDYYLKITYNGGLKDTIIDVRKSATFNYNYQIGFEPHFCAPKTGYGTIFISRDSTILHFEKGSYIEFVSGPQTPLHTYIPILAGNIEKVYPFSVDSLAFEVQDILPGEYKFKLTDSCGVVHPLTLQYEVVKLDGFGHTKDETCSGVKILPEGTIYLGSVPLPTYFRISAAPPGIAVDPASVTSTGTPNYLFLPESGQYEIQVSADSSSTSCPIDKFTIDYTKLSVSLDADSTEAYVCEAGSVGYIKVVRKGGIGPFEYELFDQGASVSKNSTGRFNYGAPGNTYTIRISDKGCKVSFDQNIPLINLAAERLIYGTFDYCPGDMIELNSLPINTNGYSWEGPNGYTSTDQFPRIPNADSINQGTYTLTVQPEGCTGAIRQSVEATNHKPEPPLADMVSIICLNTPADPLEATASSSDYSLKWYDTNGTSVLSAAPTPSTAVADTITYYVSQVSTIWGCESNKIPVKAAISDLPSIDLLAKSPVICPGMIPTVVLPETYAGYTYSLYDASTGGNLLAGGYSFGDTVKINTGVPVQDQATFYVEVIDYNACVSPGRKAVVSTTDNYLKILTDRLPEVPRGKPFGVQLESNAVDPYVFSSDYGLPWNFNLSASGMLTGTLPANGYIDPVTIDVMLKDANGCVAVKQYALQSEPFVPNVFTPNGDGYNDIFMQGHHLIIFDRLGVVIFEGKDGWNGKLNNGKKAPPDTYFYILDYEHDDGLISKRKGYITLLERD